ncbi:hypothetical protein ACHAWF_009116 [Thalassiosira exigua]
MQIVVDYYQQKQYPNRMRRCVGGNLLDVPFELTASHHVKNHVEQCRIQPRCKIHVKNGYIYMEISKGMYGLPQAGVWANKLLKERLIEHDYYEVAHKTFFATK